MQNIKFRAWSKTDCDECGCEYQVTRTEPKEMERCICGDCEIYEKAYKEGVDSVTQPPVKIIQILPMPNDQYYQGMSIGLGDDGVVYSARSNGWEVYIPLEFKLDKQS